MLFDLYGGFFVDVEGRGEAMPLRVVIRLAADLGVSEVAVRSAVLRMAQDGWLVATRSGRERHYALTQRGHRLMMEGRRRMFTPPDEPWDGRWCVVALSVPEARREVRDRMRSELSWLGFGSPSSALYVSPRDYQSEVIRRAEELDALPYLQVYRAEMLFPSDPDELVARAWSNLDAVNRRYTSFLERVGVLMAAARARREAGTLSDREAFQLRFNLGREFRTELYDDPELPSDLLPADWKGLAARRLFQASFAMLGPQAVRYYESVRSSLPEDVRLRNGYVNAQ
jgi:phenylacetic acid degradation operon negative regulatory protein